MNMGLRVRVDVKEDMHGTGNRASDMDMQSNPAADLLLGLISPTQYIQPCSYVVPLPLLSRHTKHQMKRRTEDRTATPRATATSSLP